MGFDSALHKSTLIEPGYIGPKRYFRRMALLVYAAYWVD